MIEVYNTPVLLLIFNRLKETEIIFSEIKKLKPSRLYVAADGPRECKPEEKQLCKNVRATVLNNIDWDCEVHTLLRETNIGCGKAVSQAISWFFDNEEYGIVLEDDCLPNRSFFQFMEIMLEKYKDDEQIMHVGGSNFLLDKLLVKESYYFSAFPNIWGWGTWRRAWVNFDFDFSELDDLFSSSKMRFYFKSEEIKKYWYRIFSEYKNSGKTDIWDYQWIYSIWKNKGISITPCNNLISNIGYGEAATHCLCDTKISNLETRSLLFPIIHPNSIMINSIADRIYFEEVHKPLPKTLFLIKVKVRRIVNIIGLGFFYRIKDRLFGVRVK